MTDVDSLLNELDGLMRDDPTSSRPSTGTPPSTGVTRPSVPSQARGRGPLSQLRHDDDDVEDDIDSLLADLGGDDAFEPKAAAPAKQAAAASRLNPQPCPRRDLSAAPIASSAEESSSYTCK